MRVATFRAALLLPPRTADYVSALIREGDKFDYAGWLQQVRAEEAQAKEHPQTTTEQIVPERINATVSTFEGRKKLFNGRVPIPKGIRHSHRKLYVVLRLRGLRDGLRRSVVRGATFRQAVLAMQCMVT